MPQLLISNGQKITVSDDFDKLVQRVIKSETIKVNGSILFTKHIIEVIPDDRVS